MAGDRYSVVMWRLLGILLLVVDTGAELTLLTAATVKSLLLARSQLTVSQLIGVEVPSAMPTSTRTCSWALQIFSVAS